MEKFKSILKSRQFIVSAVVAAVITVVVVVSKLNADEVEETEGDTLAAVEA